MTGGGKGSKKGKVEREDSFHVIHKVPAGDGPYVRAKHLQLVDKDLKSATIWFWKAINSGDRVDSALKDMAVVMKQQDRAAEAVEAIKSFRHCCSKQAQYSLDNLLLDLYKKCGMIEEQVELLKQKLRMISRGEAFDGKPTKITRSHGKRFHVSIKQETSRILGNLGWAYMQKSNPLASEVVYREAYMIDPHAKKACNLASCLIQQERFHEARLLLDEVLLSQLPGSDHPNTSDRAKELLQLIRRSCKNAHKQEEEEEEEEEEDIVDIVMREWALLCQ